MKNNGSKKKNPRILIVTPEITYLPEGMGNMSNVLRAKAGGLADVSASLVSALFRQGADVHVALPHYRRMFNIDVGQLINSELRVYMSHLSNNRIHLAEDRAFYYRDEVYSNYDGDSFRFAMAFQREVINNIIPAVEPDLIHCNDWMTGLIPPMARRLGIPCLFTVHNIHTQKVFLDAVEDRGIDAAEFWNYLYYERTPFNYEETRSSNRVDLLASGIFAAHFINTVSPTFLREIVDGKHSFIPANIRHEIAAKAIANCATGILNAPDETYDPLTDEYLDEKYDNSNHVAAKQKNKVAFQMRTSLHADPDAPLFFWPSRLDPTQKGCQLLADILYRMVSTFWKDNLQVAIVANGRYQQHFRNIVSFHDFYDRVTVCDFDEELSHLGYAASDFMLMPSLFEPCGLPQMVSPIYGSLPIVHDTGGLHDTVNQLNVKTSAGNGFIFKDHNTQGLFWAVEQAMKFFRLPEATKNTQIDRIMIESKSMFNHDVTAKRYIEIYETMLNRPLVNEPLSIST
ncbi:MAG: glycogen/starch synthase [Victivallaceae bacterium]